MDDREKYLSQMAKNIEEYGFHLTCMNSATVPKYAYTVGLTPKLGIELVFAGGAYYLLSDLHDIFRVVAKGLPSMPGNLLNYKPEIENLGSFSLSPVHGSWSAKMALGVFDFFKNAQAAIYQIKPDTDHHTLEIPDMSLEKSDAREPVWEWLDREWDLAVPEGSSVVTDIWALQGDKVIEVLRTEESQWEMFSLPGPDVPKEAVRVMALATMLGIDTTLHPIINLETGKGCFRSDATEGWQPWG
jgi:hypothetical protein